MSTTITPAPLPDDDSGDDQGAESLVGLGSEAVPEDDAPDDEQAPDER